MHVTYEPLLWHIERLAKGTVLLERLLKLIKKNQIRTGILWVIGVLESVSFAYYDHS